jgi:hypothetical protein
MESMDGLIKSLQQIQEKYQAREKELIQKHQHEKILWEDEKKYLEDEIQVVEEQYKHVVVEKGKYHKMYLKAKEAVDQKNNSVTLNNGTPDKNVFLNNVSTPDTDIIEPAKDDLQNKVPPLDNNNGEIKGNNIKKKNKLAPTALLTSSLEEDARNTTLSPTTATTTTNTNNNLSILSLDDNIRNKAASPSQKFFYCSNTREVGKEDSIKNTVSLSGWLSVKTVDYPYAISRWVSMKQNGMLLFYVDSFADTPIHGFTLNNHHVNKTSDENSTSSNKALSFTIHNETKTLSYIFYCSDVDILNKWVDQLKIVCRDHHKHTEISKLRENVLKQCKPKSNIKADLLKVFKMMDERQEIITAGALPTEDNLKREKEKAKEQEKSSRKLLQAMECKLKLQNIAANVQRLKKLRQNVLKMKKIATTKS